MVPVARYGPREEYLTISGSTYRIKEILGFQNREVLLAKIGMRASGAGSKGRVIVQVIDNG
ncbi:MAG: hypothetical protein A4E58_03021 [Syntrophorhabdus sp. PtaB.Bin006]|nr:MAG: hypothetical protein A4E58_03021 [Syntrophorhabdus sp. PtaB.Bin006]